MYNIQNKSNCWSLCQFWRQPQDCSEESKIAKVCSPTPPFWRHAPLKRKTIDNELNKYDQLIIVFQYHPPDRRLLFKSFTLHFEDINILQGDIFNYPLPLKTPCTVWTNVLRTEYFKTLNSLKLTSMHIFWGSMSSFLFEHVARKYWGNWFIFSEVLIHIQHSPPEVGESSGSSLVQSRAHPPRISIVCKKSKEGAARSWVASLVENVVEGPGRKKESRATKMTHSC